MPFALLVDMILEIVMSRAPIVRYALALKTLLDTLAIAKAL
jgi:hypothetical protein